MNTERIKNKHKLYCRKNCTKPVSAIFQPRNLKTGFDPRHLKTFNANTKHACAGEWAVGSRTKGATSRLLLDNDQGTD